MLKKRAAKDWECNSPACVNAGCKPEQCLKKKTRGAGARRGRTKSRHSISTRPKRVKVTGSRVQAKLKSSNKSKSSMTTFSKICECPPMVELPEKRLKSPKHKTRGILKEPKIQEKTMKTYTLKKTDSFVNTDKKQVVPESKLKSVVCKCKTSKSSNSLTTILRRQTMQSVSKSEIKLKPPSPILRNKPKQKLVIKEVSIEEKPMKNKVEPQLVLTEVVLEEKKPLKKSKKSKLGHALCECKPSTKSFSSMTSISKSNVLSTEEVLQQHGVYKTGRPRQHIKPVKYPQKTSSKSSFSTTLLSKPKLKMKETMRSPKRYKQEKNIILIRHKPRRKKDKTPLQTSEEPESGKKAVKITSSFKFEIEFSKKLNPELTNREQIIPDVQPTNERRMKPIYSRSQHKKYQHSKTQVSDMPCVCELSKSSQISQISNFRESVSQTSKPRRGSVLPYAKCECDPENYARILLSRSKPQRRSAISSTDRLRRKSTGSSTFSSRDTETFTKNNYPPPQNIERDRTEISHPKRQAVRITSNFSFDIEFYRDKSPTTKAEKKNEHTDYRRKYKERDYETRDSHSRQNTLSQSRSSQSFKNIQLGHRLKRCLCTLRLSHKKIPKVTHVVSRKTMTSFRTKELVITASKKKTQTCECEPYFYTPGECNPYVCPERLKELNRKQNLRVSKDTNTMVAKKKSISAYAPSTKSFSKGIQHRENKLKKPKSNYSYSSKEESRVSSGKTAKQAVRIGSNFTFDIEFSKKINNEQNLHGQEYATGMKKGRKQLQHKGIKVYKPRIRHESSEMYKPVKTKQTHTEPFLRKCFCTLKLLKKNKKKEETSPLHHNTYVMHMQNNTFTTNRADIHYNYGSKIQPFEYMCIPEERNPCMREKPLRLREIDLQNKFSRMTDLAPISALSNMTQTMNSSETHYTASNNKDSKTNNVVSSRSKQKALRVGSTFSCNIELLKKKSAQKSKTRKKSTRDKIQERDHQKIRLDTIESQDFKKAPHVAAEIEHNPKKKGSSLGAALKKCFCTFKFPRCNNNGKQENKNNIIHEHTKPLSNPQIEFKSKKKISQFLNPVKSDALVPNFCFPKMCESYNCYEKLQHPEINRSRDRNVNTDRHKKSVMRATSSFNSSSKSKSTQSRLLEQISAREKKMRVPQKDTGTTCFLSPSRQAVRISSNFRIKANNYFVPSTHNIGNSIRGDKHNSESKTSTANKIKGTNDKQVALKQSYPKSEKVRKEQKSSNVGFLLKRCFCTLGLQTKYTTPKTQMLKSENQKNLPITTQLVPILQSNDDSYNCNARAIPKLNCGIDEYRYGGVPLELKLPKDPFKEYIFGHQNCTKNIDMKNSTSFEKRLKSGINLNFNEYQVGYLINTQRLSPFYQSFYALNLKVSKLKNAPQYTHDLQDNKYEPRICAPYECDPVECLKRIDSRFQKSKLSETDRKESKSTESYEKNKKNKNKMVKVHKKCCFGKHQGTPMTIRSDLSLNMRVHKNLKLKNNNMQYSRHDVHVASDARVAMSLYKAKKQRNDGTPSISRRTHCRTIASQSTQTQVRLSEARNCCQGRNKASGITKFLSKCFCKSKLNNESQKLPEKERKKSNKPKEKGLKLEKAKDTPENKKTKPNKLKKKQINAVSENKKNCKCEETSVNKPCRKSIDANRSKYKSTASLMSRPRKSIKLRSIQPKGKDWSSCSNCVQKKRRRRDNSLGQSRNVTFVSHVDMMNSYKDGSQGKGDQARSGDRIPAGGEKKNSKKSKELSLNNAKNTKGSIKVFCMFNSLFKGNKSKQQPIKNIDSEPLFELLVNEGDMQIMNKEEVLHNLGSTGEESEAMKIARTAIQKGEVSPPRIEMIIDRKSARVLNKEEIIQLINKQGTKTGAIKQAEHLPQLRTAQVRTAQLRTAQLRTAQTTGSHPQGGRKIYSQSHGTTKTDVKKTDEAKPVKVKPRKFKPCICGSVVCRKNLDNLKKEQRSVKSLKIKPCVCGSDICKEESQKMPKVLLKAARRAQHAKDLAKQHIIDEKTYQKQRLVRKRIYARDDKELHHKRAIENKREMKLVKKYDTAPSVLMVAESLIDLGGFGANAFCDIMRSAVRVARHPRDGVYNIKDALHDPSHAAKEIKQTLRGMGLFATFARIKRRMLKMPVAKAAIGTLESFPVTNYLVHIADKDPKHRMKKFKQKRFREPLDFQCSLFMGSLRKRPFLKVYFMCPWFYPHCLGMLKIWQQFVDIIIFLLAVVVWSPCILTMELCRYLMCFVFCSGG
uniref:Post-SET domain-containing protein n=1 Tax=Heliothis virescens TaxID=7102 RepID=A0A2A4J682_HELVI